MPSSSERPSQEFLIFRLWGPMASWGDIAVGERRGTWNRPSRSAVLGLVAAALGIERSNRQAHDQLEQSLGFGVRVDHPGRPLRDYHTAQSPGARKGRRWFTRRDELADKGELNTILSERSYLIEPSAAIILWRRTDTEGPTLAEIKDRLIEPLFTLYLGRKSCPLGIPLVPVGPLMASDPRVALAAFDANPASKLNVLGKRYVEFAADRNAPSPELWLDAADTRAFDLPSAERTVRRDRIRDRSRWLFNDRDEVRIAPGVTS